MPKLIPFVRLVVITTRVLVEMAVMSISVVASQTAESETALSQVIRVIFSSHISTVARISRVSPLVILASNGQIDYMLFRPNKINKILLM